MIKKILKPVPCLLLALLIFLNCSDTQKNYYPTLDDVIKDGAMAGGWIPEILPSSSRKITEKHNIDTNTVWIKFTADASDLKILLSQLRILSRKEIDELYPFSHPKQWWAPNEDNRNSFTIAAYDYKFRWANGRAEDKIGYFFMDFKKSVAYIIVQCEKYTCPDLAMQYSWWYNFFMARPLRIELPGAFSDRK